MEPTSFQIVWFCIIGTALAVFMALDGFDLGVGMLGPFWTKNRDHQALGVHSIWPVWDGNELWGLAAAGALLAVFPRVFTLVLPAFYPFVFLLIAAIIYRPISFEIWFYNKDGRRFWLAALAASSFGIALLVGVVIGNSVWGMALSAEGRFVGSLFSLLNPFSLLTGLVFVGFSLLHGATWLMRKTSGEAQAEARKAFLRAWILAAVLVVFWVIFFLAGIPLAASKPLVLVCLLLALIFVGISGVSGAGFRLPGSGARSRAAASSAGAPSEGRVLAAFVANFGLVGSLWGAIGASQFPVLIQNRGGEGPALTVMNASSPESSLQFLGTVVPIFIVLALGYTVFVYTVFKGKMKKKDTASY